MINLVQPYDNTNNTQLKIEADGSTNVNAKISDGTDNLDINTDGSINANINNVDIINDQLKATPYHSDGTEGVLITGLEKIAGKDGIDSSTNTLQTIDYAHHEIHSGSHYLYKETHNIAKNATKDHLVITPNTTKWAHMVISVESTASQVLFSLYEDTVTSANGTLENTRNRNRNVADNNTTQIYEDPTVTSEGNLIKAVMIGTGAKKVGGDSRDNGEIVFKQNANYLIRVTEQNVVATDININFDWYEHTNKN